MPSACVRPKDQRQCQFRAAAACLAVGWRSRPRRLNIFADAICHLFDRALRPLYKWNERFLREIGEYADPLKHFAMSIVTGDKACPGLDAGQG